MDGGEQLPDEEQGQTNQDNANNDTEDNRKDVYWLWTFSLILGPHSVLIAGFQFVDESVLAVVLVPENAQLFSFFIDFNVGSLNGQKLAVGLALFLC